MMILDSAVFILMAEGLMGSVLLVLGLFVLTRYKRNKEMAEVELFVNRLADEEVLKSQMLEKILLQDCRIEPSVVAVVIQEVSSAERALMRRVVQLFLQRDPGLLNDIDQLIANLSDPYCKILADKITDAEPESGDSSRMNSNEKIAGLERINQQIVRQLDTAMQTIDEITAEYTRVFSGNQTALELENSSKKMQQIFMDAEHRIKENIAELET